MSNIDHVVQEIHDILKAYYKVSRKRFIDNVCMQATDHHLVSGSDTPLKIFSPKFVSDLTKNQLEEFAGEDPSLRRKRNALTNEIKHLKARKKILL